MIKELKVPSAYGYENVDCVTFSVCLCSDKNELLPKWKPVLCMKH